MTTPGTPVPIEATDLPKAIGKDLQMQIRLIEERYERFFPQITYHVMKKAVETVTVPAEPPASPDAPDDLIVGEDSTTQFDRLWGERVPSSMSEGWQQPHLSALNPDTDTHDATSRGEYRDTVEVHGRIQRISRENELKKLGFDRARDLVLFLPLFTMARIGIRPTPGDFFEWDGDPFDIQQVNRRGWWKNTNVRLFYVCSCEHRHKGS